MTIVNSVIGDGTVSERSIDPHYAVMQPALPNVQ